MKPSPPDSRQLLTPARQKIWASLMDPTLKLDEWFWEVHSTCTSPRPIAHHPGSSFLSIEAATLAEAATYLQEPARHIPQLRWTYDLIREEKPRIRQLTTLATMATRAPTGSLQATRLLADYLFAWSTMLSFGAVINYVLRYFESDSDLWPAAIEYYNEMLELSGQCERFRPFGAGFMPEGMKAVWAATSDIHSDGRMESLLRDYETDVKGANYVDEAKQMKQRLHRVVDRSSREPETQAASSNGYGDSPEPADDELAGAQCVIL